MSSATNYSFYLWVTLITFVVSLLQNAQTTTNTGIINNAVQDGPEFTDIIENITVPAGRNIKLACSVKNLGVYKVAWMHFEQSAILTVHNHVITRNPRISVTHDKHDKHKTWFLHISNVQEEDKGRYMCQINTVTAKTQIGYLHVVVPPNIDDNETSSDLTVDDGANVTLKCKATGSPEPSIRWKRDDNSKIKFNGTYVSDVEGEVLEIRKVGRLDMGAYLCIASNGIPPSLSKRIKLDVDFPPLLWVPQHLVGIPISYNITLNCSIEMYPTSINYWARENDSEHIVDSEKYKTEFVNNLRSSYKFEMRLTIYNVQPEDYGLYRCYVKNLKGEADGVIRLYSTSPPTTPAPPTTVTTTRQTTSTTLRFDPTIPYFGQTNSPTVHLLDKGTKYQSSNLNEVDRSEQKSSGESSKSLDWPQEEHKHNRGSTHFPYLLPLNLVMICAVVMQISQ
ncbi:lachesin-like [Culicoides brevitarsis]|uniref:lachesin-like n=1 Tax=Culicoides brevitarsis TaxID=469753 RepID=UPI00307B93F4